MKRLLLTVVLVLGMHTPSYGQAQPGENPFPYNGPSTGDIAGAVVSALFGGGGELPVKDAATRVSTAGTLAKMIIEIAQTLKILQLDEWNSQGGGGVNDAETQALIFRIKQLAAQEYPILWDGDLGAKFNDSMPGYHPFPEGGWIRNEEDRFKRSLTTQREVMKILQERSKDWERTNALISESQTAITSAEGRNAILQAIGSGVSVTNWQLQALTAMTMAGVNSTAIANARKENEIMSERMQERYFMTNGGRSVPMPTFEDVGLLQ